MGSKALSCDSESTWEEGDNCGQTRGGSGDCPHPAAPNHPLVDSDVHVPLMKFGRALPFPCTLSLLHANNSAKFIFRVWVPLEDQHLLPIRTWCRGGSDRSPSWTISALLVPDSVAGGQFKDLNPAIILICKSGRRVIWRGSCLWEYSHAATARTNLDDGGHKFWRCCWRTFGG